MQSQSFEDEIKIKKAKIVEISKLHVDPASAAPAAQGAFTVTCQNEAGEKTIFSNIGMVILLQMLQSTSKTML
jgi:hypothetical protein